MPRPGVPRPGALARLLDIGCKEAAFSRLLAPMTGHMTGHMAGHIVGVDITVRPPADFDGNKGDTTFVTADGQALPFRTGAFDFVLMNDVLEHIPDDRAAARMAVQALAPNGRLWLSTPASRYRVGPNWVTARFERAWGHVRKGYEPDALARLFSPPLQLRTIVWPEPAIRAMQLPNWLISRLSMGLARRIATLCFRVDRRVWASGRSAHNLSGHLYLSGCKPPGDR